MDSRERTFLALEHQVPDRIPVDFWASAGCRQSIKSELGLSFDAFLDVHDVDLRYIAGPRYVGPPMGSDDADFSVDIWGVLRKLVTLEVRGHVEHYKEVVAPPLSDAATVEDVESYPHWPSADLFDYGDIESQCDRVREQGRVVVFMGDRLNRVAQLKPAMYIRGADCIMLDMAASPGIAHAIFSRIRAFYLEYLERILRAANGKIDIVLTGDDFGSQEGLLVSPAMWTDFLREGFADYVALVQAHGAVAMHHTCGSVGAIIPAMMECGLDVLQSLQPEARGMEPARLKAEHGERLAFHGGVSIQRTLPYGTPDDVRKEVQHLAAVMGEGGGYVFCTAHNVQADTPTENVLALMGSYHTCGAYA
ncbi:MAG: hypothetical protein KAX19_13320 [Candidatus Brocadiae bacterium]|nr:hypothetical protein [Candidatus Brocadiia bacterium]